MPDDILEQQRRTLRAQHAVTDLGHFQVSGDRRGNTLEFADLFQLGDEIAQVVVFHVSHPFHNFFRHLPRKPINTAFFTSSP